MSQLGWFLLVFGLPAAAFPYRLAKFNEALDAIGSQRKSSEVEPAGWNVFLTRAVGVVTTLVGAGMVLTSAF